MRRVILVALTVAGLLSASVHSSHAQQPALQLSPLQQTLMSYLNQPGSIPNGLQP